MKRPNKALQPTFSLRKNAAELGRSAVRSWTISMNPKRLIAMLLVIAALAAVGLALDHYQRNKVALPSGVVTLAEFAIRMPTPEKVIAFEKDGSSYFEVIGRPRPSFPTVPSGPPAYIFDSTGHISYWTIDVGDSPQYWKNWQNRSRGREVSMGEALESVRQ
jgi:hypothetical protein